MKIRSQRGGIFVDFIHTIIIDYLSFSRDKCAIRFPQAYLVGGKVPVSSCVDILCPSHIKFLTLQFTEDAVLVADLFQIIKT